MNLRLFIVLIVLTSVIASALGVVYTRHESRGHAAQLGLLEDQRDQHIAEWSRLQIEQAWRADAGNVENTARGQLGMHSPEETVILVIEP